MTEKELKKQVEKESKEIGEIYKRLGFNPKDVFEQLKKNRERYEKVVKPKRLTRQGVIRVQTKKKKEGA